MPIDREHDGPVTPSRAVPPTVRDLEPTVERLLRRHLGAARQWYPHEYVPWELGRDIDTTRPWRPDDSTLSPAAAAALFVNLLTEDNLPSYFAALRTPGSDGVWADWAGRWTAEEGRHAIVIRDYVTVTRAVDPCALERARMQQVSKGWRAPFDDIVELVVYAALQELATRIAHRNTGKLIDDPCGVEIMNRVAADENLHHLFYRDLAAAAIDIDPSRTVSAIDKTVRSFAMPGTGIPDFATHARVMAAAGVYDYAIHLDQVVRPVVLQHWRLEQLTGLDAAADAAREHTVRHIDRLARVAARAASPRGGERAVVRTAT